MLRSRFRSTLLVLGAFVILCVWTSMPIDGSLGPVRIRRVDPLSGLRPRPAPAPPPPRAAAKAPSPASPGRPVRRRPTVVLDRTPVAQPIELFDPQALQAFTRGLAHLVETGEPVRVAYFGDSIVEGDMITQDLRAELQRTFGGSGVGYLPITSEVAQFRTSVVHTFSPTWQRVTLLDRRRAAEVGVAGLTFLPRCAASPDGQRACSAWVEYAAANGRDARHAARRLRVYYSHAAAGSVLEYTCDDGAAQRIDLEPGETLREAVIEPAQPARKVHLTFSGPDPMHVYGVTWDGEPGVSVDNFAMRGHSGLAIPEITAEMLQAFDHLHRYHLIILHYGINATAAEAGDLTWFRVGLGRTIAHVRAALPESAILVVGVSDRSYKQADQYETMPCIPGLVEDQRRTARGAGVAFWDLYAAMGGYNSMVEWVQHEPPLAALDFTHLSAFGSRRIATGMYRALLAEYGQLQKGKPAAPAR